MNVLLVGCGAMGGALKEGWEQKLFEVNVTVTTAHNKPTLSSAYDVIVFAVKPITLLHIAADYRPYVAPSCTFISIAAGISIASLNIPWVMMPLLFAPCQICL